jgi:glutamine amidotransferase
MQILFDSSTEHQDTDVEQTNWNGISQWPGVVEKLQAQVLPHMGWNTVTSPEQSKMFAGIENERFYFVHTYAATKWILNPEGAFRAPLVTWTNYEQDFVSAVENGPLWATQFHPEKSGPAGLRLLQNWVDTL